MCYALPRPAHRRPADGTPDEVMLQRDFFSHLRTRPLSPTDVIHTAICVQFSAFQRDFQRNFSDFPR